MEMDGLESKEMEEETHAAGLEAYRSERGSGVITNASPAGTIRSWVLSTEEGVTPHVPQDMLDVWQGHLGGGPGPNLKLRETPSVSSITSPGSTGIAFTPGRFRHSRGVSQASGMGRYHTRGDSAATPLPSPSSSHDVAVPARAAQPPSRPQRVKGRVGGGISAGERRRQSEGEEGEEGETETQEEGRRTTQGTTSEEEEEESQPGVSATPPVQIGIGRMKDRMRAERGTRTPSV